MEKPQPERFSAAKDKKCPQESPEATEKVAARSLGDGGGIRATFFVFLRDSMVGHSTQLRQCARRTTCHRKLRLNSYTGNNVRLLHQFQGFDVVQAIGLKGIAGA